jgi:hypothetical protein
MDDLEPGILRIVWSAELQKFLQHQLAIFKFG